MKQVLFTPHGGAQLLREEGGKVLWSSDDDMEFLEEFGDEVIDPDSKEDLEVLTEFLLDNEYLRDDEEFETAAQYIDEHTGEVMYVEEDESEAEDDDE